MQEIMERYLPLIYSNFFEYDPLSNVDFTEEYTREIIGNQENNITNNENLSSSGTSTSNSSSESSGYNINNDTPQTRITKQNLDNGIYASNTNQSDTESTIQDNTTTTNEANNNSTSNQKGNSNTIEKFTRHEEGDNGVIITNQRLIKEFREIIVAVDEQIINELNELFMFVY